MGLRDKLQFPEDPALDQPAAHQNGVNLILQSLQDARQRVVIIFVGSARDVVAAFNRRPDRFRDKVRRDYGFIGDARDPTPQECSGMLDPQAFVRLLCANVPFHWVPCFDGAPWTNRGHATFRRIRHGDVLDTAPPPCSASCSTCSERQPTSPSPISRSRPARRTANG